MMDAVPSITEAHPNVFISWSGERSKRIAEAFKLLLECTLQNSYPWMSSEDIAKGSAWSTEIQSTLSRCDTGVLVLTPENLSKPWVLFEAGAISKGLKTSRACTLLIDVDAPLTGPLGQFQATKPEKSDVFKLIKTISEAINHPTPLSTVEITYERFWDDFNEVVRQALASQSEDASSSQKQEFDVTSAIKDVLSSIRIIEKRLPNPDLADPTYGLLQFTSSDANQQGNLTFDWKFFTNTEDISDTDKERINSLMHSRLLQSYKDNGMQNAGRIDVVHYRDYRISFSWEHPIFVNRYIITVRAIERIPNPKSLQEIAEGE